MKNLPNSIRLGREQLKASGNDLMASAKKTPELAAEILLAYFEHHLKRLALRGDDAWRAHEMIIGAADALDEVNRDAAQRGDDQGKGKTNWWSQWLPDDAINNQNRKETK